MDRFEGRLTSTASIIQFYLHSSMDRFEEVSFREIGKRLGNLHSSMDRFEDLSSKYSELMKINLHSSMDRFEGI